MPAMIELDRSEPETLNHQYAVGHYRRDNHPNEQRHLEQQRQTDGTAEEFGEVGRHGGNLADDPHRPHHRARKLIAAHLRQVSPGDDAELGGKGLEKHGNQIREQHHP